MNLMDESVLKAIDDGLIGIEDHAVYLLLWVTCLEWFEIHDSVKIAPRRYALELLDAMGIEKVWD